MLEVGDHAAGLPLRHVAEHLHEIFLRHYGEDVGRDFLELRPLAPFLIESFFLWRRPEPFAFGRTETRLAFSARRRTKTRLSSWNSFCRRHLRLLWRLSRSAFASFGGRNFCRFESCSRFFSRLLCRRWLNRGVFGRRLLRRRRFRRRLFGWRGRLAAFLC